MFSICRQTHPATGIEHAVSCCFFNNEDTCLITAGANILKVFRLLPEGHTKEVNAGKFLLRIFYDVAIVSYNFMKYILMKKWHKGQGAK